jgi:hypothetical protein
MITGIGDPAKEYASLIPEKYESGIPLEVAGDNLKQDFNLAK